jgi:putative ubiquitin-RnfH superfamily antitoxin RatB of RatAB toxin-antitoxin module
VACDTPAGLQLLTPQIPSGTTVAELLAQLAIAWPDGRVGIWGRGCERTRLVADGDRVELYRELLHDPKAARRSRAKEAAKKQRASKQLVEQQRALKQQSLKHPAR